MTELKPCPCGQTPTKLVLLDSIDGSKYAYAYGDCCGEWYIYFRRNYINIDSIECIALAAAKWNRASRGGRDERTKGEISTLKGGDE